MLAIKATMVAAVSESGILSDKARISLKLESVENVTAVGHEVGSMLSSEDSSYATSAHLVNDVVHEAVAVAVGLEDVPA